MKKKNGFFTTRMLTTGAITIALTFLLSLIIFFRLPMGGSVKALSLLPLILFAYAYGPVKGLIVGGVYGLLDLVLNPYVIHPIQLLVDYPFAYAATALSCLALLIPDQTRSGKQVNPGLKLCIAILLGYLGKFIMAVISGVVFFAEYAGEEGALIYSIVYNGGYMGIEAAICAAVAFVPGISKLPKIIQGKV